MDAAVSSQDDSMANMVVDCKDTVRS
jgi:hypothetical protein